MSVEIKILKKKQNLMQEVIDSSTRADEFSEYIAQRVSGGFLERDPGLHLPEDMKTVLLGVSAHVDSLDINNANLYFKFYVASETLKSIQEQYVNEIITEEQAIAAIDNVEIQ